ncbi:uncharacterized protein PHALS_05590 [Plasmopara halstedii]|uniref:Uncharacterized protein n=1 Tax=Plasmopara halstedii TaxID=4781 RepID=A0A0P1B060_PLAHL|nr:uncharacterized protein PHALS_05590 [Plasmopara halstedii]CEG48116.1 hypothetical protein PHALS_05590 [Plasmopara halstedii]|eukprot:XP_024584485.1 hypothetical protein PHALS_05590 [Plasmopara halstedii]
MSTNLLTKSPDDIFKDDSYFLWESAIRMTLARKKLLFHLEIKLENTSAQATTGWKTADLNGLDIVAKKLITSYQLMILNALSAAEACGRFCACSTSNEAFTAVSNFARDSMSFGLAAVGDESKVVERLVIFLGSLSAKYECMVKIIEARG